MSTMTHPPSAGASSPPATSPTRSRPTSPCSTTTSSRGRLAIALVGARLRRRVHGRRRAAHHGSYEDLVADPDVDVVYVATPHGTPPRGRPRCASTPASTCCARRRSPSTPTTRPGCSSTRRGERGPVLRRGDVDAHQPAHRPACARWSRSGGVRRGPAGARRARLRGPPPTSPGCGTSALGASALLDVGIYPLTFAHLMLGEPGPDRARRASLSEHRRRPQRRSDPHVRQSGAVASIAWTQVALGRQPGRRSRATGAASRCRGRFHHPRRFHGRRAATSREEIALPVIGRGYAHEIEEVAALPARRARPSRRCCRSTRPSSILAAWTRSCAQIGVDTR